MLDRRTGKPVFVEQESAVPASTLLGEHVALLAPHSPLRFMLTGLREKDMWDATPFDQLYCRIDSQSVRYQRTYSRYRRRASWYSQAISGFSIGAVSRLMQSDRA